MNKSYKHSNTRFTGLPDNIKYRSSKNRLELTINRFSYRGVAMLAAIVIANLMGTLIFKNSLIETTGKTDIMLISFASTALLTNLILIYLSLTRIINKTYVEVNTSHINIYSKPVNYPRPIKLRTYDFRQLHTQAYTIRARRATTTGYRLYAENGEGVKYELIEGLEKREQAEFLEQEIEKFLKIKDSTRS